ncbi:MAG: THUMP domain-containing protein [Candidatus Sigynarchaeota archaeon]
MPFIFNMIISTPRNFETDGLAELDFLVHQIFPENKLNYGKTIVTGLIWGNLIGVDPVLAVHRIKDFVREKGFPLQYLLKFVPIQKVLLTDFDEIEKYILSQIDQIRDDEKYKVVVNKRRIHYEKIEIIEKITKNIHKIVDLEHPDKIIRLEIIGKYTGISIIKESDVFSTGKKVI